MSEVSQSLAGSVLTITIRRPHRLNALTESCRAELLSCLQLAAGPDVRAVILTGEGRAFCVGQDLAAGPELVDAYDTVHRTYNPLVRAIRTLDVPVIAAVNGLAVGAGMGLALAGDLVLMADTASFACSFGKVGLVPDTGLSSELVRRVGHARAFELASTGRFIMAEEARHLGLATHVVPTEVLEAEARRVADSLAAGPGLALALTKRLLVAAADLDADELLEREAISQGVAASSVEHREGATAFLEKRDPNHPAVAPVVPAHVPSAEPYERIV